MKIDPLHQFQIKKILNLSLGKMDISLTNSSITTIATTIISIVLLSIGIRKLKVRSISVGQSILETLFLMSNQMIESSIGRKMDKSYIKYAKYIFSSFLLLLGLNLQSMIPKTFAVTGQFAITLMNGLIVMIISLAIMIKKNGIYFLKTFVPNQTPAWIAPLIMVLELISFLIRPISLCIRLSANIIAGHVMLEVVAVLLANAGLLYGSIGFPIMVAVNLLEVGIVCLQAYIFTLLSSVYIGEALSH